MVSPAELESLERLDFPCSQDVLATARRTERGVALEGSWTDLDRLAGWVTGEANHARRKRRPRQTELLDSIADQLENVLAAHRGLVRLAGDREEPDRAIVNARDGTGKGRLGGS